MSKECQSNSLSHISLQSSANYPYTIKTEKSSKKISNKQNRNKSNSEISKI